METKTKVKANEEVTDNNNGIEVYNKENVLKDKGKSKKNNILSIIYLKNIIFYYKINLYIYNLFFISN